MALSKFSEDYDFFFRNAPLRDLKQVHAHFLPSGLKFIVTKQAVLLGLFNGPKLLTLARDDPSIVAKILAKRVALDLAYTSVRRALERTALALLEEELAARFFRGRSAGVLFCVVYCATSALFQIPHALRPRHWKSSCSDTPRGSPAAPRLHLRSYSNASGLLFIPLVSCHTQASGLDTDRGPAAVTPTTAFIRPSSSRG